jgi:hypothetical protein
MLGRDQRFAGVMPGKGGIAGFTRLRLDAQPFIRKRHALNDERIAHAAHKASQCATQPLREGLIRDEYASPAAGRQAPDRASSKAMQQNGGIQATAKPHQQLAVR